MSEENCLAYGTYRPRTRKVRHCRAARSSAEFGGKFMGKFMGLPTSVMPKEQAFKAAATITLIFEFQHLD